MNIKIKMSEVSNISKPHSITENNLVRMDGLDDKLITLTLEEMGITPDKFHKMNVTK